MAKYRVTISDEELTLLNEILDHAGQHGIGIQDSDYPAHDFVLRAKKARKRRTDQENPHDRS